MIMNKELARKLYLDFPELYKDRFKPCSESLMCFGFEHGDGWFELVYKLSEDLMVISSKLGIEPPVAVQVKEKFGTLRFYVDGYHEAIGERIEQAELESGRICEVCGNEGKQRNQGWVRTLCDRHAE